MAVTAQYRSNRRRRPMHTCHPRMDRLGRSWTSPQDSRSPHRTQTASATTSPVGRKSRHCTGPMRPTDPWNCNRTQVCMSWRWGYRWDRMRHCCTKTAWQKTSRSDNRSRRDTAPALDLSIAPCCCNSNRPNKPLLLPMSSRADSSNQRCIRLPKVPGTTSRQSNSIRLDIGH